MWPFERSKYSALILYFYDGWLMNIANPFIWRCSTKDVLIPLNSRNIGANHCDIGCGTGYYLACHDKYGPESFVTLLDIEPTPLYSTTKRLLKSHPHVHVESHRHDILSSNPLPYPPKNTSPSYDSISLMYLLHTLPVSPLEKASIFGKIKPAIKPSGVIFGATILGHGPWHSFLGRLLLRILNWEKRLSNYDDSAEPYVKALKENFSDVKVHLIGSILIFEAREPRQ